jgi:diguanylate cyclase (GGDEF)-like protein
MGLSSDDYLWTWRIQMVISLAMLLMLDVDQFKRINDCHGHAAGDRALIAFKDACQQVLRDMDIFGRWGGDEFVVLVPDGYESAYTVAERVRQAVKQVKMVDDQGKPFSLRTTIGFASTNSQIDEVPTLDELLACADRALYSAKEAGRNRVKGVLVV